MNTIPTSEVEYVSMTMYRSSQHKSLAHAYDHGGAYHVEATGYSSAMDTLYNMSTLARMMDHYAVTDDIMIEITINKKVTLPVVPLVRGPHVLREATHCE